MKVDAEPLAPGLLLGLFLQGLSGGIRESAVRSYCGCPRASTFVPVCSDLPGADAAEVPQEGSAVQKSTIPCLLAPTNDTFDSHAGLRDETCPWRRTN
jgi:hypothetical protein